MQSDDCLLQTTCDALGAAPRRLVAFLPTWRHVATPPSALASFPRRRTDVARRIAPRQRPDDRRCAAVPAADFYDPLHRAVYAAIERLHEARLPIDPVTVADALRGDPNSCRARGGITFLMTLAENVADLVARDAVRGDRAREVVAPPAGRGRATPSPPSPSDDAFDGGRGVGAGGATPRRAGTAGESEPPAAYRRRRAARATSATPNCRPPRIRRHCSASAPASTSSTTCSPASSPGASRSSPPGRAWERRRWRSTSPGTSPASSGRTSRSSRWK